MYVYVTIHSRIFVMSSARHCYPLIRRRSHQYFFFFLMIRRPPRSTLSSSSAASDVYKRQVSTQSTGVGCWSDGAMVRTPLVKAQKIRRKHLTESEMDQASPAPESAVVPSAMHSMYLRVLYVSGFDDKTTPDQLLEHFSRFGEVSDVAVVVDDDQDGQVVGCGFVTYEDERVASYVAEQGSQSLGLDTTIDVVLAALRE
eukprot:TRINITY_DN13146_c0_g1_i3.p1 TRINITY_DN13146_c0_g1~~TRINITY_DN13146_c0_g1_i3.p1  ORF type:complete len:200 (+),score=48.87 TRINITY_DN13146_c0_g1_i3:1-600(+)